MRAAAARRLTRLLPSRAVHAAAAMPLPDGGPTAAVAATRLPTGLAVATLARPSKLNALDTAAVEHLLAVFRGVRSPRTAGAGGTPTPAARALLLRGAPAAGGRAALCAGGDVLSIRNAARATGGGGGGGDASALGEWPAPPANHPCERVFQAEYNLISELPTLPAVVLLDGIVMGLGAGLAAAAGAKAGAICIATDRFLWAMPEQAIALFPDVGFACWGRAAMSPRAVLALGLSGARVSGGSAAVRCGLATHALPAAALPALEDDLRHVDLTGCGSDADVVAALRNVVDAAASAHPLPAAPPAPDCVVAAADDPARLAPALDDLLTWRDGGNTGNAAGAALTRFRAAVDAAAGRGDAAAAVVAAGLAVAAPVSQCLWLRLVTDAAALDEEWARDPAAALAAQLDIELRPASRLAVSHQFDAGVTAVLERRAKGRPDWPGPPSVADVRDATVDALLAPLPGGGLDAAYYLRGGERE